jgi:ribosomal protein S18 acetylase RimI-like enzyme
MKSTVFMPAFYAGRAIWHCGVVHDELNFRAARSDDADAIALLHADSWRRHYRGAYSDSYLDGDVETNRRSVWSSRLAAPTHSATIVAENGAGLAGFVHVVFDNDDQWGSLVDNLHVVTDRHRSGIGRDLMRRAGAAVIDQAASTKAYLWVLEQNARAQAFYGALGGACVEKTAVDPPGGIPERLDGAPNKLRIVWSDAARLLD